MTPRQEVELEGRIRTCHPHLSRCFSSQLLAPITNSSTDVISTLDKEIFGNPLHPIELRIGNGGAGYTGILKLLAETYIEETAQDFRIGWVSNHSRHSQLALLGGVVQVALTYEPENEEISVDEGWAERIGTVFNDHFLLAGPPGVALRADGVEDAFQKLAATQSILFHSRGDGSATFTKEQRLWEAAGTDVKNAEWIETYPLVPYDALVRAEKDGAFLLTDRSTYLTAKQNGVIPSLRVHVEGGEELLNPCSALVGSSALATCSGNDAESRATARTFAQWLGGARAQKLIGGYGTDWDLGMPLFTVESKKEFDDQDRLVGRC